MKNPYNSLKVKTKTKTIQYKIAQIFVQKSHKGRYLNRQ